MSCVYELRYPIERIGSFNMSVGAWREIPKLFALRTDIYKTGR